jgi:hypothetical protein
MTFPIIAPQLNDLASPTWAGEITDAVNDHEDRLDSLIDEGWTNYVATWTAGTGTPSLGNGTIAGRYRRIPGNDLVRFEFKLTIGSTTNVAGTVQWYLSIPVTASADAVTYGATGAIHILDNGTTTRSGIVSLDTTTRITFDTTGGFTATSPQTWATGDYFKGHVLYEAA